MGSEVIYFVSDTHLGDGSGADRFLYPGPLMDLLGKIEADPDAHLVLLGDFLELWAASMEAIMIHHASVFHAIGRISTTHKVSYVVGNHDCLPWYYFLGQQAGQVDIGERFTAKRGALVALHGHQFDPFNQVKVSEGGEVKTPWTRNLVKAVGLVERVAGDPAGDAITNASEALSNTASAVAEIFRRESPGERGYPAGEHMYDDAARALMRSGAQFVIFGHTHHPLKRWYGKRLYVNTGSWVWDRYPPTYARFANGQLELLNAKTHEPYS